MNLIVAENFLNHQDPVDIDDFRFNGEPAVFSGFGVGIVGFTRLLLPKFDQFVSVSGSPRESLI